MPVLYHVPRKIRDTVGNKIQFVRPSESLQEREGMHLPPLLCHSEHAAFLGGSFDPLCLPLLFPGGVKFFLFNGLILHRMSAVK